MFSKRKKIMALSEGKVRIVGHVDERTRDKFNAIAESKGISVAKWIGQIVSEKVAAAQNSLSEL